MNSYGYRLFRRVKGEFVDFAIRGVTDFNVAYSTCVRGDDIWRVPVLAFIDNIPQGAVSKGNAIVVEGNRGVEYWEMNTAENILAEYKAHLNRVHITRQELERGKKKKKQKRA